MCDGEGACMSKRIYFLGIVIILCVQTLLYGQSLENSEVRMPYAELVKLLPHQVSEKAPPPLEAELLALKLRLEQNGASIALVADVRAVSYGRTNERIPLLGGGVSLLSSSPDTAHISFHDDMLTHVPEAAGVHAFSLRMQPALDSGRCTIKLAPCASTVVETMELPREMGLAIDYGEHQSTIAMPGEQIAIPLGTSEITLRLLDKASVAEVLLPPEPSKWVWQQESLILPEECELSENHLCHASANDGSGVDAELLLPADAHDITVAGNDLAAHSITRSADRGQVLHLTWKTRNILDRAIMLSYTTPVMPLDETWHIQAPGAPDTPTRFLIASVPLLSYASKGLSAQISADGLPLAFRKILDGRTCQMLESKSRSLDLHITRAPIYATAKGIINTATWSQTIEPDGSMILSGEIFLSHQAPIDFTFDTPPSTKLLTCSVGGNSIAPEDLGDGKLKLALTPNVGSNVLHCSFTGKVAAFDPVEGTLPLSLPLMPFFTHNIKWSISLPIAYQAETNGNLKRTASDENHTHVIALSKNLCIDERPQVNVFYQKSNLNP